MRTARPFLLLLLALAASTTFAQDDDRAVEIGVAKKVIADGSMSARVAVCQRLDFSGITDVALFDAIESKVLEALRNPPKDGDSSATPEPTTAPPAGEDKGIEAEYEDEAAAGEDALETTRRFISNCGKALATSGNAKYLPTLTNSRDLYMEFPSRRGRNFIKRSFVTAARTHLPNFATWNPIINAPRSDSSGELARIRNMLQSSDLLLQRVGALSRIRRDKGQHPYLYDAVEVQLVKTFPNAGEDADVAETTSQYCKALAESGDRKYLPTLLKIEAETQSSKLRRYASSSAAKLQPSGTS